MEEIITEEIIIPDDNILYIYHSHYKESHLDFCADDGYLYFKYDDNETEYPEFILNKEKVEQLILFLQNQLKDLK